MLNKLDKIMLAVLLALLVTSGGIHWQDRVEQPVEPEAVAQVAVGEVAAQPESMVPDFGSMMDVKAKKNAFFGYLHPLVEKENDVILKNRQHIIALSSLAELTENDKVWLANLAKKYRLRAVSVFDEAFFQALLTRVDMIPPSLALAQSANETAWGTSRFARQGNNFFGQWCFSSGCGIVPAARPEGKTYEVQKFEDVAASVRAYMHNLNTNHQYEVLRELRGKRRITKAFITGPVLAHGLYAYSIRG
nr:glucosaminidase domain-containing protein [Endozoicomonas sp.]